MIIVCILGFDLSLGVDFKVLGNLGFCLGFGVSHYGFKG